MTTKKTLFLKRLGILLAATPIALASAQNSPEIAPNPRLQAPPAVSGWTIAYQYPSPDPYLKPPDPSQAAVYARLLHQFARVQGVEVSKNGNQRKEVWTYDDGSQKIRWIVGDLMVIEDPKLQTYAAWDQKVPGTEHFSRDFESLSAIDSYVFKGHQSFHGSSAVAYQAPGGSGAIYVDPKTSLPIAVEQGPLTLTYTFTPTAPFEIPPEVKARIEQNHQATGTSANP